MTKAQEGKYWRMWKQAWDNASEEVKARYSRDEYRHLLTLKALGDEKTHFLFSNRELDKVLAEFATIGRSADMTFQWRQERQPQRRLVWKIQEQQTALLAVFMDGSTPMEQRAAAERYVLNLMRDKFGTDDITKIGVKTRVRWKSDIFRSELETLRDTLDARIAAMRRKKQWTNHELHQLAGVACYCSTCRRRRIEEKAAKPASERREEAAVLAAISAPF